MAISSTRLFTITFPKEDNFHDQIIDIRAYLRKKKLWKYTQKEFIQEEGEINRKEIKKYEEKVEEATNFITPTLTQAVKK